MPKEKDVKMKMLYTENEGSGLWFYARQVLKISF